MKKANYYFPSMFLINLVYLLFFLASVSLQAQPPIYPDSDNLKSGCTGTEWKDTIWTDDNYDEYDWTSSHSGSGEDPTLLFDEDESGGHMYILTIPVTSMPAISSPATYSFNVYLDVDMGADNNARDYEFILYPSPEIAETQTNVSCSGGEDGAIGITVSAGAGPYEFAWTGSGGFSSTSEDINDLSAGDYSVTVTDQNDCKAEKSYNITEPEELNADISSEDITCNEADNGSITITNPAGGSGTYQYSIDGGVNWQNSGDYSNLSPDTYNVQIRDANQTDCIVILDETLILTEPDVLSATVNSTNATCGNNGTITITDAQGGTNGYQYSVNSSWQDNDYFTGLAPGNYTVMIRDAANTSCVVTLNPDLEIISETLPVDLLLVLDLSGSMLSHMPAGAALSKLRVLENATKVFLDTWQTWTDSEPSTDHRIGLTYFKTSINSYPLHPVCDLKTDTTGLHEFLISQTTTNYDLTAIGGGLQNAINILDGADRDKKILLFTDGMQNVNPLVDPGTLEIKDCAGYSNSNIDVTDPLTNLNNIEEKIYVVGVGISNVIYENLLKDISLNDDQAFFTMDANTFLDNFFSLNFAKIMSCNSPRLIDYRYGNIGGESVDEEFVVSDNAEKILFKVVGEQGQDLDFKVFKGDVEIPSNAGKVSHQDFYKLFFIKFPLIVNGQVVNPGGEWTVRINGRNGSSYKSAAFEDEYKFNFDCAITSINHRIGDTIKLKVNLDHAGQDITDECDVKAIILKPGVDLGNMLATTKIPGQYFRWEKDGEGPSYIIIPPERTSFESNITPGHKKFQVLMNDPEFFAALQATENVIHLKNHNDGSYTGYYTNIDVSGHYRIIFQVNGSVAGVGNISRIENKSIVVRYGTIQRSLSDLYVIPGTGINDPAQISIRPRDQSRNFIGPEYGENIKITISDGSVGALVNKLDGRYIAPLSYPDHTDPIVTITVFDEEVYRDKISDLEEKFSIGLTGAYALPVSNFSTFYSGGPAGSIDFEWRFKRIFSLDLQAGLWGFKPDYNIMGGTAFLYYIQHLSAINMTSYLGAGAGVYKPKDIDLSTGFAGKIGLKRRLGGSKSINKCLFIDLNHLWLDINATYYYLNVPNNDRDFFGLGVGLRYSFR